MVQNKERREADEKYGEFRRGETFQRQFGAEDVTARFVIEENADHRPAVCV